MPIDEPISPAFGDLDQNQALQEELRTVTVEVVSGCRRDWAPPREKVDPKSGWVWVSGTYILSLESVTDGYVVVAAAIDEPSWVDEGFFACLTGQWAGRHLFVANRPTYMQEGDRYRAQFPFRHGRRVKLEPLE